MGAIKLRAYANCDDVYLVWRAAEHIPGCRGFALYRRRNGQEEVAETWVGFQGDAATPGTHRPSTTWPIQRFTWTDYGANSGDALQYRVVPMVGPDRGHLKPRKSAGSSWSSVLTLPRDSDALPIDALFNRGIVAAQWVARALGDDLSAQQEHLRTAIKTPGNVTRNALAGLLREELLRLLTETRHSGGSLHAAIYELSDPELIEALAALGERAHIVLANGSYTAKNHDPNSAARTTLKAAGVDVIDRLLEHGHLAHHKFAVFSDAAQNPRRVWTGSTNWSPTGLCTQANNGLVITNAKAAKVFQAQWEALKAAQSAFPANLETTDAEPHRTTIGQRKVTIWFTPVAAPVAPEEHPRDLQFAIERINRATEGLLFLFFNPGPRGSLLNAIVDRTRSDQPTFDPKLYVHGVLNQDPSTTTTEVVGLFGHEKTPNHADFEVVLPAAVGETLPFWIKEVRKLDEAHAMVHSKVVVVDPFGAKPIVMTGSHNLGPKGSRGNDENLVIIEGDRKLAAAYAVNIMSIYNQYRWRFKYHGKQLWTGLRDDDLWQDSYRSGSRLRELQFWLGEPQG